MKMKMKKGFTLLLAAILTVCLLASCGGNTGGGNTGGGAEGSGTAGTSQQTAAATATQPATSAPTAAPEPTPEKEALPTMPAKLVDALITDFAVEDKSLVVPSGGAFVDQLPSQPYITISTAGDEITPNAVVPFAEELDGTKYPYIAIRYKLGLGESIGGGNQFFGVLGDCTPREESGWFCHPDTVNGVWDLLIIDVAELLPAALQNKLYGLRIPGSDAEDGTLCIAYMGAFASLEDITTWDTKYTELYKDYLKADTAGTEKEESFPDTVDAFTEGTTTFESETPLAGESTLEENWFVQVGIPQAEYGSAADGGKYLTLGFESIAFDERLASGKAYSVTCDVRSNGDGLNFAGMLLNYGSEGSFKTRTFFETNGLVPDGQGSITGCSGIGFFFRGNGKITVYVITYDDVASKMGFISYEFDAEVDYASDFVQLTASDDGAGTVQFLLNGKLAATVTYAGDALLAPAAKTYNERYYRDVKILAADGSEQASTNIAVVAYTKAFGFGARSQKLSLDNITVSNTATKK